MCYNLKSVKYNFINIILFGIKAFGYNIFYLFIYYTKQGIRVANL